MFRVEVTERGIDQVIAGLSVLDVKIEGELILEDLVVIGERTMELAREIISFDTGAAWASLQFLVDNKNLSVKIGSDGGVRPDGQRKIYLRYLELGTSKMTARPFLMPSLLQAIHEFRLRFPQKIREVGKVGIR
jgi:hypothetical protein